MIRLSDVLSDLITRSPLLLFGLQNGLLNLTQTAHYLQPLVEVRAKKSVKPSAILMALSRLQRSFLKKDCGRERYRIENIAIHGGLCTYTFQKTDVVRRGMQKLYLEVQKVGGYMTISESTSQITTIVDAHYRARIRSFIPTKPFFSFQEITAVGITFDKKFIDVPGLLAVILQQIMLQGINVIEIASTFTEFILYLKEEDVRIAFDTLYALFTKQNSAD